MQQTHRLRWLCPPIRRDGELGEARPSGRAWRENTANKQLQMWSEAAEKKGKKEGKHFSS